MKNYYDILGVSEDASNDQIKKAFKEIAKKEHPDRGGDEARFKEANEAYDTLKNSQKRHDYDTMRKLQRVRRRHAGPTRSEGVEQDAQLRGAVDRQRRRGGHARDRGPLSAGRQVGGWTQRRWRR